MHPLLERKKAMMKREFVEVPLDVKFKGEFCITNVPHVKEDIAITGLDYTVRSSVQANLGSIYEYMRQNGIKKFDYNDYHSPL